MDFDFSNEVDVEKTSAANRIHLKIQKIKAIDDYDLCPDVVKQLHQLRQQLRELEDLDKMIYKYLGRRVFGRRVRILFSIPWRSTKKLFSGSIIHTRKVGGEQQFIVLYSDGDRSVYSAKKLSILLDESHYFQCERTHDIYSVM